MKNKIFLLTLFAALLMPAIVWARENCVQSIYIHLSSGHTAYCTFHDVNCNGSVEEEDWCTVDVPRMRPELDNNCNCIPIEPEPEPEPEPEGDRDEDGVVNRLDNCPYNANGDCGSDPALCDANGDGTPANEEIAVGNQLDSNADSIGDACTDTDNDGFMDFEDNCPELVNSDQTDLDNDGAGDACEADSDGDKIPDDRDVCPLESDPNQRDSDEDGMGDVCDNCGNISNFDQADSDGNGIGDLCETDTDKDGISDSADNCKTIANQSQMDVDGDGMGDACDTSGFIILPPAGPPRTGTGGQDQGCSLVTSASGSNLATLLMMAISLLPIALRRQRS